MEMKGINNIRIDDRLIHGQVATMWSNKLGVTRLMVVNDNVAKNDLQKQVLRMAVQKRLALTITPEYLDLLHKVSAYQNIPTSTFVMGLLEGQRPVVEALLKAFQDMEAGKDKQKILSELLASGLEAAAQEMRKD